MKTLNDLRDRLTAEMAAAQARLSMVAAVEAFAGDVRAMGLNVVVEVYPTNVWIDVYLDESGQGVPTNPDQDRVFAEDIEALIDTLSPTCDPAAEFLTELPDGSDLGEDYDALIVPFDAVQVQFDAQIPPEYSVSDLKVDFPARQADAETPLRLEDDTPEGFPSGPDAAAPPPVAESDMQPGGGQPGSFLNPWTPAELALLWEMNSAGRPVVFMAETLGRSRRSVEQKRLKLIRGLHIPAGLPGGNVSAPDAGELMSPPVVSEVQQTIRITPDAPAARISTPEGCPGYPDAAAPPPAAEPDTQPGSVPVCDKVIADEEAPPFDPGGGRDVDQRLDRLGNKGRWSDPADDLALIEGLTKGMKLAQVALDLGIDAGICKLRFAQLVPEPGIVSQGDVIAALRRRIAARAKG